VTKGGAIIPSSEEMPLFVAQFAFHAAVAIEGAFTLRDQVLRIVKLAELRDPEIVEIFFEIHDVIRAIGDKWKAENGKA